MPRIVTFECCRCGAKLGTDVEPTAVVRGLGPELVEKAVWLCGPCVVDFRAFLETPPAPAATLGPKGELK